MNRPDDGLRDRLLGQYAPDPGKLASYRKEIEAMLELEERRLRFNSWISGLAWVWAVFLGTSFALVAGYAGEKPTKVYFTIGVTLLLLVVGGAVQLLGVFINRARLAVTKDIKGLELRFLELEARLRERGL